MLPLRLAFALPERARVVVVIRIFLDDGEVLKVGWGQGSLGPQMTINRLTCTDGVHEVHVPPPFHAVNQTVG